MKKLAALTLSLFLMSGTAFADSPKDTPKEAEAQPEKTAKTGKAAGKTNAQIARELEELRESLKAQQEQLQLLKEELAKRDREIEDARKAAADANARAVEAGTRAADAATGASEVKASAASLNTSVSDLRASNDAIKTTLEKQEVEAKKNAEHGPTTIRYKGVNITPGGFIAAETVTRNHATGGDIATPFTGIPFNGNSLAKVTESNFSGRQSRLTLLADTKVGGTIVKGYYEADFLGAGVTSNNRQTNSYVFRQRQLWAEAITESGWSITGGQQWTLASENKKGIQNTQEWFPIMVDVNYVVGWFYDRAYGFRVAKNFNDTFAVGVSIEGPQTTIGGRGFSTYTSTAGAASQNFFLNTPGAAGGLYNSFDATGYTPNKLPDFVVKAALDPGWGHYEVFGIISLFRNRVYPCAVVSVGASNDSGTVILKGDPIQPAVCVNGAGEQLTTPSATAAFNDSRVGGGGGVSARLPLSKKVDFGVKVSAGSGINRFGAAQLQDVTARPDGSLALLRGEQALVRLEWHPTPKFDLYAYWGNEYAWRAGYVGYETVAGVATPAIPATATGGPGGTPTPAVPATTTWTTKTGLIGGYGSRFANNSGCGNEVAPGGTSAPGAGGTCAGDIRNIQEYTLGFWHKFYQGEKGRVQWGLQYSYVQKNGWSGNNSPTGTSTEAGISPKATDNMFFTSFRYYLP